MKFTIFRPKITKQYLLDYRTQEDYMSHYLGIPIKKGLFCNPLRVDNRVTCSFYKNKSGILIFHDFATGQQLNFIDVVMTMYNLSYHEALERIAEDFGLVDITTPPPKKIVSNIPIFSNQGRAKIQVEIRDFNKDDLKWWGNYGIDSKLLNKYHVYACKNVFLNENLFTFNTKYVYGYYGGKKDGLELWRIYYTKRREFRFLSNWDKNKIQGYEQLPKNGKLLVITKSMKDVMCLKSLGIDACAPCSENLFIKDSILTNLKERFKYIVCFYDNDIPGIHNMRKIKKEHPELNYFFIPRHYEAKDISDFRKKYGKDKTINFIKECLIKLKKFGH